MSWRPCIEPTRLLSTRFGSSSPGIQRYRGREGEEQARGDYDIGVKAYETTLADLLIEISAKKVDKAVFTNNIRLQSWKSINAKRVTFEPTDSEVGSNEDDKVLFVQIVHDQVFIIGMMSYIVEVFFTG